MPPPRSPSWEQIFALRLRFERGAKAAYPGLYVSTVGHRKYARVRYTLTVPVADYEPRLVEMHFRRTSARPALTRIYADGPAESLHRYEPDPRDPERRHPLCIWYPHDPPERRWTADDGLLSLIEMSRVHLFKEAYWRDTGEWLGDEVMHRAPALDQC